MAKDYNIYRLCGQCGGEGVVTRPSSSPPYDVEELPCDACKEKGGIYWGWLEKEN